MRFIPPKPLRILQVANVGKIVGGTAACAWSITRALLWAQHHVVFLSPISGDTRAAFPHARLHHWDFVAADRVAAIAPDLIVLHNTSRPRVPERVPAVTIQFLHSRITPALADHTLYCSRWLRDLYGDSSGAVLHQPVPRPAFAAGLASETTSTLNRNACNRSEHSLLIGRFCTPQARKWPPELADFYRTLARRHPRVRWEFVGCPPSLELLFRRACGGRAEFHVPGWEARSHLARWDALLYHHPTLTESFGRTCAEAMRAGCIPIVDNRGGFLEQFPEPPSSVGFLCGDLDAFDRAIEELRDPRRRRELSLTARVHGDAHFSLGAFARQFVAILKGIVGGWLGLKRTHEDLRA